MRKTVTVLFADVVASTELGERLDPEALRQVVTRYFAEMAAVLEAHGGTVEKFIGDEVMAVFGVPAAHEDDALRAVRAASAMRERLRPLNDELEESWGARLAIRIGINTGEVMAGDPAAGHGFVSGSAVNVAKRLEQAAEPGEILLGDATHRLVRHAVKTTPIGPLSLRGKRETEAPQRLDEVRAEAEALARRFDAPLVGRRGELTRLEASYAAAVEGGRAHLVTLLGSPGIGKSRLAKELLDRVGPEATTLVGRCPPYGEGITFWPIRQILPDEPLVGRNEEIFLRIRRRLEELARARPLVVAFDDVHWAEPTLLDLVQYLAGWIREAPVLLLCLARPELLELRPDWLVPGAETSEVVVLGALRPDAAHELLHALDVAEDVRAEIAEAAEGNPLFVEQMAALALERGSGVLVPPSIRALLRARLDTLTPEETAVVERAAVVGRDFSLRAVSRLLPDDVRADAVRVLLALVRKDLVRPRRSGAEDGFRFRHALIRDAAYESLPKSLRAELHERHAALLADEQQEAVLVAYHLEQAVRSRRELGLVDARSDELATRAGLLLAEAGRRAFRRDDVRAAVGLLERARELLPESHRDRPATLVELGSALIKSGRLADAHAAIASALDAARDSGDRRVELRARIEHEQLRSFTAPAGAQDLAHVAAEVIPELEELGDDLGLAKAWRLFSDVHVAACRWADRAEALERALSHARRADDAPQERSSLAMLLAQALYYGPVPAETAEARCRTLLDEGHDDVGTRAGVLSHLGGLLAMQGRLQEGRALYEESAALHGELGLPVRRAVHGLVGADVALLEGDRGRAEAELRGAYETLETIGESGARAAIAAALADLLASWARDDEAREFADVVVSIAEDGDVFAHVLRGTASARMLLRQGEAAEAEALAREAVEAAQATDFPALQAAALVASAEVAASAAGAGAGRALLEQAVTVHRDKGNLPAARHVEELLGNAPFSGPRPKRSVASSRPNRR